MSSVKKISFVCLALFVSSCFEIVEEITMNNDGSGSFSMTLNLSQSKTKLSSIMLLDSVQGHRVPSKPEIIDSLSNLEAFFSNQPGISNVKYTSDFSEFIFSVTLDFESIDNLNTALNHYRKKFSRDKFQAFSFYFHDSESKRFIKNFEYDPSIKNQYLALKKVDQEIFENAHYISINRFGAQVKSCSNSNAIISKSGKAVMLRSTALDLINGDSDLSNIIEIK